ncbi:hypothetical protein [Streptosporangium vulgare]|uniref:Uncharacterized protein n=1 Tax=Streptosporangium vulgare TaxID=46190 RepID=A0ABV5TQ26_9ACTN
MAKAGYSVVTGGAVALTGGTAKTVLGVKSHANFGLDLLRVWWGFVDTVATEAPVTCELCYCTWVTNSPGTASTTLSAPAITQVYGRTITPGFTAAKNWTTEPTVLTPITEVPLTPNGGLVLHDGSLGMTPDCDLAHGFALRFTAASGADTSVRATMWVERC